ncbi:oxygenase [Lithospermum erythrorhizon]|uniref:Oxygenase n=1 Tax=Lithospermum erythrorhizon TaxID=34254 RepID=A0AAV3QEI1_LITER
MNSNLFAFFFFVLVTLALSLITLLKFFLKLKPWCNCDTCKSYVSSSWTSKFTNLCDWYTHLLQHSSTGTIHVHVLGNIITTNPENVEYILKTRFENYPKGKPFQTILGDLLGRGIFNVDGHQWKFQRKMASLELKNSSIKSYAFEIVSSEVKGRLIPLLSSVSSNKNQILDLQDVFRRFSFDNICKFSFGFDPGCLNLSLPISEFALAFDLASRFSAERAISASPLIWKFKRFFNIGSERKLKEAIKLIDLLAEEVIKHKRNEGSFSTHHDLLSRFMASIVDDKYLRDIIISFLLAGRDTVASGLTSFFWLLANHPEVKKSIIQESDKIMDQSQEIATYDQLKQMHYLQASVYESLRLYPPVQFDSKFCSQDDVLPDGTLIKKGTRVTYHPYAMGRMKSIWGEDAGEFKPERWLEEGGIFKPQSPFKYPVFQAGLRVCLGKEMALVEMKCVALSIIRQFDLKLPENSLNQYPKFMPGLTAAIRGGLPLLVKERRLF